MLRAALVLALTLAPGLAFADVIPNCPPDLFLVMNPTPPGATHHGGGFCTNNVPPGGAAPSPNADLTGTTAPPPPSADGTPPPDERIPLVPTATPAATVASPGAVVVVEDPSNPTPPTFGSVGLELGEPVAPAAAAAAPDLSGEGATPPPAAAPVAVPRAGLCSASVASEGAFGLGVLFALGVLVLRRLRLA